MEREAGRGSIRGSTGPVVGEETLLEGVVLGQLISGGQNKLAWSGPLGGQLPASLEACRLLTCHDCQDLMHAVICQGQDLVPQPP